MFSYLVLAQKFIKSRSDPKLSMKSAGGSLFILLSWPAIEGNATLFLRELEKKTPNKQKPIWLLIYMDEPQAQGKWLTKKADPSVTKYGTPTPI